ncbi:MAG TPA: hypothetical protein VEW46_04070 [Pyrinomonadaceae bacterium]|nr:hypothetical protein [Pyrinomonadaceae bacterium]
MSNKINKDALLMNRKGERGAALLTTLLVAILLLSAGMALVTTTSLSTTNAIDSTAEMQAYSGAEAGLEAVLNVLRGNVAPNASLGAIGINFRNAANPATANTATDPWAIGASATSRLSGWLNYSYKNAAGDDWRVPITSSYAPNTGIAFKIWIIDPDDLGPILTRKITTDINYRPTRLIIQSHGYGPKGAIKRLEMVVKFGAFDFTPPASITLPGGPGIDLNLGDSGDSEFSGNDLGTPPQTAIPPIAVASDNVATTQTVIDGMEDDQVSPNTAGTLTESNTPTFLQSAQAARDFLAERREEARTSGRLFATKGEAEDSEGGLGTTTNPVLTFIDNYGGDPVVLGPNHQGSGMLIVTGVLETDGTTDFEGLILVMGEGRLERDGGGDGLLRGAIVVAKFDPNGIEDEFGPPALVIDGGGTSKISFDSLWVRKAMEVSGLRVIGIREYHL